MKSVKVLALAAALAAAAALLAPPAQAMQVGNYDVLTNRYDRASWFWFVSPCEPEGTPDCLDIDGTPRLQFYAYYGGTARLANGRWTLTVDVPDGLRCPGYNMPTRDTYSWDAVSLAGTIDSVYDVGCFNGPPGTQFWTFALRRL